MNKSQQLKGVTKINAEKYEDILKRMEDSAKNGHSFIITEQNLSHDILQMLLKDGFSVRSHRNNYGIDVTIISWHE